MNDETAYKCFLREDGTLNSAKAKWSFVKTNKELFEYLECRFDDLSTNLLKEIIVRLRDKIETRPRCPICGSLVPFDGRRYHTFCSKDCKCSSEGKRMTSDKVKNTCQEKYGADSYFASEEGKLVCRDGMVEKYGYEYPLQNPIILKGALDKWANKSEEEKHIISLKRRTTTFEKFGVEHPMHSEEIKEKKARTCLERYGDVNCMKNENIAFKVQQTLKDRYGENYMHHPKILNNLRCTNLEKYGEEWACQNDDVKDRIRQSKRVHGTFCSSKWEEMIYLELLKIFKEEDIDRQHKDERYPWACDFYISSVDTFIEIQGFWTHGGHPFDENSEDDLEKLRRWSEQSGKKIYKTAIDVWTVKDVLKRQTAKTNGLRYVEIFGRNWQEIYETLRMEFEQT